MTTSGLRTRMARAHKTRENGDELSAFSPTGQKHFHDPLKFGKLYVR